MKDLVAIAVVLLVGAVIGAFGYIQFAVIRDCGWMALFHGAEWWWLFGFCK